MKRSILALAMTTVLTSYSSCATISHTPTSARKQYLGVCRHPGVSDGNPFKVPPNTSFDGPMMTLTLGEDSFLMLYGAQCILQEQKESQ